MNNGFYEFSRGKQETAITSSVFPYTGSAIISGSLKVIGSITGSLFGTSSWAISSSQAISSSYSLSSSNAVSASYSATASYSKNLQISGSINNVDYIDFNTGSAITQPISGRLSWNHTDGTLDVGLKGDNVTLQVGQEQVIRVVNKTGGNLLEADYRVVRVRSVAEGGAQGQRLAVVLAQADNDDNSATTLGIVTENITVNEEGFITTSGQVRKINTTGILQGETWIDGDILYLSPTIPGYLTKVKPQAPQHTVIVGYVEYAHQNQGKIFVKVDNGYEIDELHNVRINTGSLTSGQLLIRSGSVWINSRQLTGSYGLTGSLQAISFTGSLFGTSSWTINSISSSFTSTASLALTGNGPFSGSFSGSGANLFGIPSTAITGLNLFQIATGSVTASVSPTQFSVVSGSSTEFQVTGTGVTLGNIITDIHTVTGSLNITGSTTLIGNTNITGSLLSTGTTLLNTLSGNTSVGLPTNTATARLQIRGTGSTSATTTLLLQNSALTDLLTVTDDGTTTISGSLTVTGKITGTPSIGLTQAMVVGLQNIF